MSIRRPPSSGISMILPLLLSISLTYFPGSLYCAVVTLSSIELYTTHEVLNFKPKVYFECERENKTELPDVKKKQVLYTFKGEESWQPLTELSSKKCKRCGFYEEDLFKSDVFDEWEFCPSDFTSDGKYSRYIEKEFNATFSCSECVPSASASKSAPLEQRQHSKKHIHIGLVILICVLASTILILGVVAAYKYWQKKKREQDQVRFLKLFEEGDDIEDELGLENVVL